MKLLSIDLAGLHSGWALFVDGEAMKWGTVEVPSLKGYGWIHMAYESFMGLPWDDVTTVLIEFPGKWLRASKRTSTRTLDVMYGARYMLLLAVLHQYLDIDIHEIDPNKWQKEMLDNSPWDRKVTANIFAVEHTAATLSEHEADAICMGLWWIRKEELGG